MLPTNPLILTLLVLIVTVFLILISILYRDKSEMGKIFLFSSIVVVVLIYTVYLSTTTILKNLNSETGGPIHWHGDFEIYKCGEEVKLKSPSGLSNRIGSPLLHEHGDKRIHVEGAVEKRSDISLGNFFKVIGGDISDNFVIVPTNDGIIRLENGQKCGEKEAKVQVFVYALNGDLVEQRKVENPQNLIIEPQTLVPPGNCIIIELDVLKARTDHLCVSYRVAKEQGKIYGR